MRYLITGGAGFIGSNFIHYLFKKYGSDIFIVNMDKLINGKNKNNKEVLDKYSEKQYLFLKHDICNLDKVIDTIKKYEIDTIVHFAAETHVDTSISRVLEEKTLPGHDAEETDGSDEKNKYELFKYALDHNDFVLNNVWSH